MTEGDDKVAKAVKRQMLFKKTELFKRRHAAEESKIAQKKPKKE